MTTLELLIILAGVGHFGLLTASALVPRVLDWRRELRNVSPLSRQLIWTHGVFIVLVIIAFGVLSVTNAAALGGGSMLARSVCGFIAVFWLARLVLQLFVFDAASHLTRPWLRAGYHGLTVLFAYFTGVYGYAAVA